MNQRGFTLIELMIVVTVIGLIAALSIPQFSGLIRKSREGATKGNLGTLRAALTIYYCDNDHVYPSDATNLVTALTMNSGKYITRFPSCDPAVRLHAATNAIRCDTARSDSGSWGYDPTPGTANYGTLWIDCTHTDSRSTTWADY